MSRGKLEPCGEVARQRDDGDIDVRPGEPGGALGEDPVARADGHRSNRLVHPLILQDIK